MARLVFTKQRLYWFSILTAVLVALTLGASATAAGKQVPFKGHSSGVVTEIDFKDSIATLRVVGEGQATHLGRFTLTAKAFVRVSLPGGPAEGSWILTAANGDQLFVDFKAIGIGPSQGRGDFTITGGTGRFQGATGSYTQLITFTTSPGTPPTTTYSDVIEGTISFRHK